MSTSKRDCPSSRNVSHQPTSSPLSEMLTPSELDRLRRSTQAADAYLMKAFKNHKVDLGVKDDADLDTRADATASDSPSARGGPTAPE